MPDHIAGTWYLTVAGLVAPFSEPLPGEAFDELGQGWLARAGQVVATLLHCRDDVPRDGRFEAGAQPLGHSGDG
jgi:hypothetical protein